MSVGQEDDVLPGLIDDAEVVSVEEELKADAKSSLEDDSEVVI